MGVSAENGLARWHVTALDWPTAYRVIPTRFPAANLFERVASHEDFDALHALEAMTNDRLRTEVGELDLVAPGERCFGPGCGPIMAAFTHLNPLGSRFSDGSYGIFYCAREARTAIAETRFHTAKFLAATNEPPMRQQMRLYTVRAWGDVVDLRNDGTVDPAVFSPADNSAGQALGRAARAAGAAAIVYPSVRDSGGECLGAFKTTIVRDCLHAAYLEYNWNGETIDSVFQLNQVG